MWRSKGKFVWDEFLRPLLIVLGLIFVLWYLMANPLRGEEKKAPCNYALVEWQDATIYMRTRGQHDLDKAEELLTKVESVGCVMVKGRVIVVIHSITDDKVDDFLLIPVQWALKITPLKGKKNERP